MTKEELFLKIYKEDEARAITALCLVLPPNESTTLLMGLDRDTLQKCAKLLQWMINQNDTIIKENKARIKELTGKVKIELSE